MYGPLPSEKGFELWAPILKVVPLGVIVGLGFRTSTILGDHGIYFGYMRGHSDVLLAAFSDRCF